MTSNFENSKNMQQYCLVVEKSVDLRESHYRFDPDSSVILSCGPTLCYRDLLLYTNYPIEGNKFDRNTFNQIPFKFKCNDPFFVLNSPLSNWTASLTLSIPGSFAFFVVEKDEEIDLNKICTIFNQHKNMPEYVLSMGYLVVDPSVRKIAAKSLSLHQISLQTVVSRCLGPLEQWLDRLEVSYQCGYNSIHFTPFQKYGQSGSCYSIKDHCSFDSSIRNGKIEDNLPKIVEDLRKKFNCLIVDIVLNHVSNDCPLVTSHPECFYNLSSCHYLKPAFLIDRALYYLTITFLSSEPEYIKQLNSYQMKNIERQMRNSLKVIRLGDFYIVDIEKCIEEFRTFVNNKSYTSINHNDQDVCIIQDPTYTRLGSKIDNEKAFNRYLKYSSNISADLEHACNDFRIYLRQLNNNKFHYITEIIEEVVKNVLSHIRYHFYDRPNTMCISTTNTLVTNYFSICCDNYTPKNVFEDEVLMNSKDAEHIAANQGWVMGCNTCDFASEQSEVYLRRHLIAWGDCVKIKWGHKANQPKFLWSYMLNYVGTLAKYVDGFRLDNCHSTPIHVLEFLIDKAREINPNLIVIGELFTDSENQDNLFVNRVGLTALIRERMSAHDLTSLCHIVHRFGGHSIGSFFSESFDKVIRVKPQTARAILNDMTHDNECLYWKFSPYEYLSTSAFISMANCLVGTVRGFDEMVPYQISVVSETKTYTKWKKVEIAEKHNPTKTAEIVEKMNLEGFTSIYHGIIEFRREINKLHHYMDQNGYEQIFIDQISSSIVTMTRNNPKTGDRYVMIAHHALKNDDHMHHSDSSDQTSIPNSTSTENHHPMITIPGIVEQVSIEAYMFANTNKIPRKSRKSICGRPNHQTFVRTKISPTNSKLCRIVEITDENHPYNTSTQIYLVNFPPSSVIFLHVKPHQEVKNTLEILETKLKQLFEDCSKICLNESNIEYFEDVNFSDVNWMLFKCDQEEIEEGNGLYQIPDHGTTAYHGLYGIYQLMSEISYHNNLGHPLCHNLRHGDWLLDHILHRKNHKNKKFKIYELLAELFGYLRKISRHSVPCYFECIIKFFCMFIINWTLRKLDVNNRIRDEFCRKLTIASFALIGNVPTVHAPPIVYPTNHKSMISLHIPTIAAGLPHFSTSIYRMWGRDIFISLKGLCLLAGRIEEARLTILSVAATLKHGLIPNLISDHGLKPRYNARDASWFFLNAVKDYCEITESCSILNEKVVALFSSKNDKNAKTRTLLDVVQIILQSHWDGIDFVEEDFGPQLDRHMREEGFRVTAGIDHKTGFVYGGNSANCGTWMDKMGCSSHAGNEGVPATPRDGSAIELVALCYSVVNWLEQKAFNQEYPHKGVIDAKSKKLTTWNDIFLLIESNFEKMFWIPKNREKAEKKFEHHRHWINKTGIYKDSVNSFCGYTDYQLRPNYLVAMAVAPNLFKPFHVVHALNNASKELEGHLGMVTLDKSDWNYCGYYSSGDSSNNFNTSGGFNYHNGPEWLWLSGYYMKAMILFSNNTLEQDECVKKVGAMLCRLYNYQEHNPWMGLPELTQKDGDYCESSCRIQSWSVSCVVEAIDAYYSLIESFNR